MDVKCRKTSCIYNDNFNCTAKKVNIDEKSNCDTFCKGGKGEDKSKEMFEVAPEYANSQHIRNKDLCCKCDYCLFNKESKCQANGITVIDEGKSGACATFIYDE